MAEHGFQLAQVNIALARGAMDEAVMQGFIAQLEPINALADQSPGFVWRLQTEDGDATAVRPYADDRIMINLSVWDDLAALQAFVFRSAHVDVMRGRRERFERYPDLYAALWWVPAGHRPSVAEAVERLEQMLRPADRGPEWHYVTLSTIDASIDVDDDHVNRWIPAIVTPGRSSVSPHDRH